MHHTAARHDRLALADPPAPHARPVLLYASLHFLSFIGFDHAFVIGDMARDVIKRPFVAVGFAAFVLLIPLAPPRTNGHCANWAAASGRSCIGTST
jgi:hypothetical protein